jgi:hypothetical protein
VNRPLILPASMPDEAKPTKLTATRPGKIDVNLQTRTASFDCVHPDGLIGKFQAHIPFDQLKQTVGMILTIEAQHETSERAGGH